MAPYIINLGLIFIIYIFMNIFPVKDKKKWFIRISFIEMFIFLAIRDVNVGPDCKVYIQIWNYISQLKFSELSSVDWEPLFLVFNKIISLYTSNSQIYIICTSFLALIGPYFLIKRYSKVPLYSIFLLITLQFFSYYIFTIRQSIAITILTFAIKYIKERKFFKFFIIVFLATLVHKSSILFLLMYFICNIKFTNKRLGIVFCVYIILFMIKDFILDVVLNFIYSEYINTSVSGEGHMLLLLMVVMFIIMFLIIRFEKMEILHKDEDQTLSIENICINLFLFTIGLQILSISRNIVARVVTDYYLYIILLIPCILDKVKKDKNRKIYYAIYSIICLAFYAYTLYGYIDTDMVYKVFL